MLCSGDISATSHAERVFSDIRHLNFVLHTDRNPLISQIFCIFLMLVAAFLFGTLIGELQDIFYSLNKTAREIESHIEVVSSFLISNRSRVWFPSDHRP